MAECRIVYISYKNNTIQGTDGDDYGTICRHFKGDMVEHTCLVMCRLI